MSWYEISTDYMQIKDRIQFVKMEGVSFCLVYYKEEWVAFSAKCPHAGASLVNGWCEEGYVVCPFHRHGFDLKTGRGKEGQHNYIKIYPIKMDEGKCMVYLKTSFWHNLFK